MRRAPVLVPGGWVDAVVGYRGWRTTPLDGAVVLTSITQLIKWPKSGPVEAECRCLPSRQHSCGLYAWSRRNDAFGWSVRSRSTVYGEVLLWGNVFIHERGYRGQFAQLGALYICETYEKPHKLLVELTAHQYGVPVVRV